MVREFCRIYIDIGIARGRAELRGGISKIFRGKRSPPCFNLADDPRPVKTMLSGRFVTVARNCGKCRPTAGRSFAASRRRVSSNSKVAYRTDEYYVQGGLIRSVGLAALASGPRRKRSPRTRKGANLGSTSRIPPA